MDAIMGETRDKTTTAIVSIWYLKRTLCNDKAVNLFVNTELIIFAWVETTSFVLCDADHSYLKTLEVHY